MQLAIKTIQTIEVQKELTPILRKYGDTNTNLSNIEKRSRKEVLACYSTVQKAVKHEKTDSQDLRIDFNSLLCLGGSVADRELVKLCSPNAIFRRTGDVDVYISPLLFKHRYPHFLSRQHHNLEIFNDEYHWRRHTGISIPRILETSSVITANVNGRKNLSLISPYIQIPQLMRNGGNASYYATLHEAHLYQRFKSVYDTMKIITHVYGGDIDGYIAKGGKLLEESILATRIATDLRGFKDLLIKSFIELANYAYSKTIFNAEFRLYAREALNLVALNTMTPLPILKSLAKKGRYDIYQNARATVQEKLSAIKR